MRGRLIFTVKCWVAAFIQPSKLVHKCLYFFGCEEHCFVFLPPPPDMLAPKSWGNTSFTAWNLHLGSLFVEIWCTNWDTGETAAFLFAECRSCSWSSVVVQCSDDWAPGDQDGAWQTGSRRIWQQRRAAGARSSTAPRRRPTPQQRLLLPAQTVSLALCLCTQPVSAFVFLQFEPWMGFHAGRLAAREMNCQFLIRCSRLLFNPDILNSVENTTGELKLRKQDVIL